MGTILDLLKRVESVDTDKICIEVMEHNADVLNDINKQQLYDGKGNDGQDLAPTYLNDPYFKTREAAQRYSDWKDKITPSSVRKPGVPNLYINGYYHNSRKVAISGTRILHTATYKGLEIKTKYADKLDGLAGDYKIEFVNDHLRPAFKTTMENATGLRFK